MRREIDDITYYNIEIRRGWYLLRGVLRAGAAVDEDDERVDKPFSLGKIEGTGCGGLDRTAAKW